MIDDLEGDILNDKYPGDGASNDECLDGDEYLESDASNNDYLHIR
jgi:hypothetical protein